MVTRKQWRWRVERERELYQGFGLGLWTSGGSLGTTYGEPGRNLFREIVLLVGPFQFRLAASWKELDDTDAE